MWDEKEKRPVPGSCPCGHSYDLHAWAVIQSVLGVACQGCHPGEMGPMTAQDLEPTGPIPAPIWLKGHGS